MQTTIMLFIFVVACLFQGANSECIAKKVEIEVKLNDFVDDNKHQQSRSNSDRRTKSEIKLRTCRCAFCFVFPILRWRMYHTSKI